MDQYKTLIIQAINKIDNINIPVAFVGSIGIPIAQVSGILHAIINDMQAKSKEETKEPEETPEDKNEEEND